MVIETATKFISSVIASTSGTTKDGFNRIIDTIRSFQIIPREKPEHKKELPAGGYELAMQFFSDLENPGR